MSLYLLDTDTLTLFQRRHPVVLQPPFLAHAADTIGITIVTVEEQVSGRLSVLNRAKTPTDTVHASEMLAATVESLAAFPIYPHTATSLATFDRLLAAKLNVGRMDLRIASIALADGSILVTRNRRDFGRIPGVLIEDWSV